MCDISQYADEIEGLIEGKAPVKIMSTDNYFTAAAPGDGFLVFFQEAQGTCAYCPQPANSNSELCRCVLGQGLPLTFVGQTGG